MQVYAEVSGDNDVNDGERRPPRRASGFCAVISKNQVAGVALRTPQQRLPRAASRAAAAALSRHGMQSADLNTYAEKDALPA